MASPFPANATLFFEVPLGESYVDALGNIVSDTEQLQVEAFLVQKKEERLRERRDNASDTAIAFFKGRWLSPSAPPPGLQPGAKAEAVIGNLQGTFVLGAKAGSPFVQVNEELGFPMEGELYIHTVWGEAG